MNWILKAHTDSKGNPSSKRVWGGATVVFSMALCLLQPLLKSSDSLIELFLYGGLALLGTSIFERNATIQTPVSDGGN